MRGQADVVGLAILVLAQALRVDTVWREHLGEVIQAAGATEVAQQGSWEGGEVGVHGVKVGAAERWLELLWVG